MKTFWLNKKNNSNLVLFFAGWGMDENHIRHLFAGNRDFLVVYDYSDFYFGEDLSQYDEITLIAWSMGVFAASVVCEKFNIKNSIAINGTQKPIDAKFGINPKMYKLTLENLNEATRDKFFKNMFLDENEYGKFQKPQRNIENQCEELSNLQKISSEISVLSFNFDCAIISEQDRIFSAKNQENFWQTKKVKVLKLNRGHYPFFGWNTLEEIINEALQ